MRRTLAIAGAIILTLDLQTHTRLPEGRYLVLVLDVTYGVLLYMAVRWRRFIPPGVVEPWLDVGSTLLFPSAGATLSFAYPEFEVRPAFVDRSFASGCPTMARGVARRQIHWVVIDVPL